MKNILEIVLVILSSFTYFISFLFVDAYISVALKLEKWTRLELIDSKFKNML